MMTDSLFHVGTPKPICLGTGLVALDVLIHSNNETSLRTWAGGSCGNVLAILAYFGWVTYPLTLLGNDYPSKIVLSDLVSWGVKTDFVRQDDYANTPVVIEKLRTNGASSSHIFEFRCPNCGAMLPRSRPIPYHLVQETVQSLPSGQVFYFDRASKSALEFARIQREDGALIVFEPSSSTDGDILKSCLRTAHIVKYSNEQIDVPFSRFKIPLEIQTLGAEGLRYRSPSTNGKWNRLPAFHVAKLVDVVGAGDWCTAGVVQQLGQKGTERFLSASQMEIQRALRFGQALASLCCMFEGARGIMYELKANRLKSMTERLVNGVYADNPPRIPRGTRHWKFFERICQSCQTSRGS